MTDITISMPDALQNWVDARLADGTYADVGDYLRDLVRQDQRATEDGRQWLRAMIHEGLESGVLDQDPREIIGQMIAEDPDLRG